MGRLMPPSALPFDVMNDVGTRGGGFVGGGSDGNGILTSLGWGDGACAPSDPVPFPHSNIKFWHTLA